MKIRTDFVTNSSSSSFVIGKASDINVSKDYVYQLLRKWYSEYDDIYNDLHPFVGEVSIFEASNNNGSWEFDVMYDNDNNDKWVRIDVTSEGEVYTKLCEISVRYGLENCILFGRCSDNWWDTCLSYDDFLEFFSSEDKLSPPFFITDLSVDDIMPCAIDTDSVDYGSDTLFHFTDGLVGFAFSSLDKKCDDCLLEDNTCPYSRRCKEYDADDWRKINEYKTKIKKDDIPKERACLYFLGKVCVQSFETDIPYWIVDRLTEMSEFSDIHW